MQRPSSLVALRVLDVEVHQKADLRGLRKLRSRAKAAQFRIEVRAARVQQRGTHLVGVGNVAVGLAVRQRLAEHADNVSALREQLVRRIQPQLAQLRLYEVLPWLARMSPRSSQW